VIHEQNSVLGRVNRMFAADAAVVASGFARLQRLPGRAAGRHQVVGNPVRAPIVAARAQGYPLAPAGGRLQLLVIGGSQGARLFGEVIPAAVLALEPGLRQRLRVVQQVREEQVEAVRAQYVQAGVEAEVAPFFRNIAEHLAGAHLVIARAGASTVTELLAVGRPAILVPLAIATDDHQTGNAAALVEIGAADLLTEGRFTPPVLAALLAERLADPHQLSVRAAAAHAAGRVDAAEALADLAERAARA
jgi:UDP-N-acetylglucosamine--N-acetylmuramyl-(pentapeptide) pyrophosphoryl-undecaprenol N-acetylglucosamine transferase